MYVLNNSAKALSWLPVSAELAPWVFAMVLRDEKLPAEVVRLLPELRSSLQYMVADRYYVRPLAAPCEWRALPRCTLWAPSYQSAFGYAKHHIKAFAIGLTAAGWQALHPGDVSNCVNQILDFSSLQAQLARAWQPEFDESLAAWHARIAPSLCAWFAKAQAPIAIDQSPSLLAAGLRISEVAKTLEKSERHFRRLFEARFGVSAKIYQRIHRVDRMLRQLHEQPWEIDDCTQALSFADQAHSIREFKAVVGITPTDYVRGKRLGNRTLRSIPVNGIAPPDCGLI